MCEFFATYGRGCLDFVKNELIILEKHFNTKIQILNDKLEIPININLDEISLTNFKNP